jgi:hypothetical protein
MRRVVPDLPGAGAIALDRGAFPRASATGGDGAVSKASRSVTMSRPNVTDDTVAALLFARACVLDQRANSHKHEDLSWDASYKSALEAIDGIVSVQRKASQRGKR